MLVYYSGRMLVFFYLTNWGISYIIQHVEGKVWGWVLIYMNQRWTQRTWHLSLIYSLIHSLIHSGSHAEDLCCAGPCTQAPGIHDPESSSSLSHLWVYLLQIFSPRRRGNVKSNDVAACGLMPNPSSSPSPWHWRHPRHWRHFRFALFSFPSFCHCPFPEGPALGMPSWNPSLVPFLLHNYLEILKKWTYLKVCHVLYSLLGLYKLACFHSGLYS